MAESLGPPNAIPPRTSSTGLASGSSSSTRPVRQPVAESDRLTNGKRMSGDAKSSETLREATELRLSVGGETSWSAEKEKIVMGPFDYMSDQPGKDIRKQLIAAFNRWLNVPAESLAIITRVVTMLHTASLL
jgi:geranylgeranyl diphosphate synthase type 3